MLTTILKGKENWFVTPKRVVPTCAQNLFAIRNDSNLYLLNRDVIEYFCNIMKCFYLHSWPYISQEIWCLSKHKLAHHVYTSSLVAWQLPKHRQIFVLVFLFRAPFLSVSPIVSYCHHNYYVMPWDGSKREMTYHIWAYGHRLYLLLSKLWHLCNSYCLWMQQIKNSFLSMIIYFKR